MIDAWTYMVYEMIVYVKLSGHNGLEQWNANQSQKRIIMVNSTYYQLNSLHYVRLYNEPFNITKGGLFGKLQACFCFIGVRTVS